MKEHPLSPLEPEAEVIEPEIVGHAKPASLWRRIVSRLLLSLALGAVGLCLILAGILLIITVVGAAVGVPLLLLGLALVALSLFLLFGGGTTRLHIGGFHR